eukprot:365159-Chlamydomonas_euryale.AAC.1
MLRPPTCTSALLVHDDQQRHTKAVTSPDSSSVAVAAARLRAPHQRHVEAARADRPAAEQQPSAAVQTGAAVHVLARAVGVEQCACALNLHTPVQPRDDRHKDACLG